MICTWRTVLRNTIPVVNGKCLTRFRTASSGTAPPAADIALSAAERESVVTSAIEQLLAVVTRAVATREDLTKRRHVVRALPAGQGHVAEPGPWATGVERAAGRYGSEVRRLSRERIPPDALCLPVPNGAHHPLGVRG